MNAPGITHVRPQQNSTQRRVRVLPDTSLKPQSWLKGRLDEPDDPHASMPAVGAQRAITLGCTLRSCLVATCTPLVQRD